MELAASLLLVMLVIILLIGGGLVLRTWFLRSEAARYFWAGAMVDFRGPVPTRDEMLQLREHVRYGVWARTGENLTWAELDRLRHNMRSISDKSMRRIALRFIVAVEGELNYSNDRFSKWFSSVADLTVLPPYYRPDRPTLEGFLNLIDVYIAEMWGAEEVSSSG